MENVRIISIRYTSCNNEFTCHVVTLGERQQALSKALEKAPPKSYLDAMGALLKWIQDVEQLLESEPFFVNEPDIMEDQVAQFRVRE